MLGVNLVKLVDKLLLQRLIQTIETLLCRPFSKSS